VVKHDSKRSKTDALLEEGTLNPTPEKVRDPKFQGSEFFDPHDAVQVKYEILRRVSIDNTSVTEVSDQYGISRPTYYQAKANFDAAGIARVCSPVAIVNLCEGDQDVKSQAPSPR
jgi:Homeodomain-like domain